MTASIGFRVLAAVSLLVPLMLAPTAPAAAQSSEWTTDYGPLILTIRNGDHVTGLVPTYQGRIDATLNRADRAIDGYWRQPTSEVRCDQAYEGSFYWGQVSWTLRRDGSLQGQWGYCRNPPGSAGVWNGAFVKGTHPMSTGEGQRDPAVAGTAPGPDAPGPDVMEVARFLWGPNADPARLTVLREDVSCDGKPDLSLVYLDLDSPDGPFLSVAVRETGATLEQIPATYLDFDTGAFASLCGPGRMVDVSVVGDLEPESVLDLTGFTAPPVCRVGLRLDDGMCDAVWVFTMPGQDRLTDLVIGRN